jgi:alpha-L-rhamnosidase
VSEWKRTAAALNLNVTIPPGSTASIFVPTPNPATVKENGKRAASAPGVNYLRWENGASVFAVGSGTYNFSAPNGE